jgi:hypothetical protein
MEAAKGFRRLKAYKHLAVLRAALAPHQSKYVTQRVERQTSRKLQRWKRKWWSVPGTKSLRAHSIAGVRAMSGSPNSDAVDECLRRAAEARRLAAASRNFAQKADLLDVAQGWLRLAGSHEPERDLQKASGWWEA